MKAHLLIPSSRFPSHSFANRRIEESKLFGRFHEKVKAVQIFQVFMAFTTFVAFVAFIAFVAFVAPSGREEEKRRTDTERPTSAINPGFLIGENPDPSHPLGAMSHPELGVMPHPLGEMSRPLGVMFSAEAHHSLRPRRENGGFMPRPHHSGPTRRRRPSDALRHSPAPEDEGREPPVTIGHKRSESRKSPGVDSLPRARASRRDKG